MENENQKPVGLSENAFRPLQEVMANNNITHVISRFFFILY